MIFLRDAKCKLDNTNKFLETAEDDPYKGLMKDKLPSLSIYDLLWFNIWKINAEVNKKDIPADYEY